MLYASPSIRLLKDQYQSIRRISNPTPSANALFVTPCIFHCGQGAVGHASCLLFLLFPSSLGSSEVREAVRERLAVLVRGMLGEAIRRVS